MTLYEIDGAIANFEFQVDEATGELLNVDELDSLQMAREQKLENIALFIKELDAECEAISNESKILSERLGAKQNKRDGLKRYLQNALAGEKFETPRCRVSYRKSQQVILSPEFDEWAAENAPELLVTTTTVKPDKAAIKAAIKDGKTICGATIVDNQNIQVK